MGKSDKYTVTAKWQHKLLTFILLMIGCAKVIWENPAAGLSLFIYSLLFVFLAVNGSKSRFARWLSEKNFFMNIFLVPSVIWAFYCGLVLADDKTPLAIFSTLLTILSIPFAFLLLRLQGGIRKIKGLVAFVIFPLAIYYICEWFVETALSIAIGASVFTVLVCFIIAVIEYGKDHKADFAVEGSKEESGRYTARWDTRPQSDVKNNVIYLRGNIVVDYTGDFYQPSADKVVKNLIDSYTMTVARDMKGYSVNGGSVNISYNKLD